MVDRRRSGAWPGVIGMGLLAGAVALPIASRHADLASQPEEIERRNAELHQCEQPGCLVCKHNREWLRANPGRRLGDLFQATESPGWRVIDPSVTPAPAGPEPGSLVEEDRPIGRVRGQWHAAVTRGGEGEARRETGPAAPDAPAPSRPGDQGGAAMGARHSFRSIPPRS